MRKSSKSQIGNSNEELLTLAPTTITPSFHNSVSRHFKALPYQVSYEDPFVDTRHGGSSHQQPRCISLFPSTELQTTSESPPAPNSHNVCNGEVGENIDLNLRL
ncbi:hypothetical protein KSS87_007928 [Heliosperma pusillum]|nr:hypothetical protein KSS87_007928 [Heliosperma pusillum]